MITPSVILAINPGHPSASVTAGKLTTACLQFGILDARSVAALLANCGVESGLVPTRENLYYSSPTRLMQVWPSVFPAHDPAQYIRQPERLANLVYAGELGNKNEASGDGWGFRGAGYLQHTGRANFAALKPLIGFDVVTDPALLEQIGVSALAACAFWTHLSQGHASALRGDIPGTRRAVNGPAMLGLGEMTKLYQRVLPLLH